MRFLFVIFLFYFIIDNYAQNVGIGDHPLIPHPSAGLEINFSDKGLLIPRLTSAQRNSISNPAHTLLIWNVTTQCIDTGCTTGWIPIWCLTSPPFF
ncbi:MAG: hypothetical protein N2Z72_04140 [Bacteroidales bacterium]|nr:hypothetical protein [Bacteroidales bacterium]